MKEDAFISRKKDACKIERTNDVFKNRTVSI